jgi:uncharacterized protein YciU (UPF0263 family)
MATKITIMRGDVPAEGVSVVVGEIVGEALITNERGNVAFDLAADWQGFVDVRIDYGSIATATVHIIEGETHIINIGPEPE